MAYTINDIQSQVSRSGSHWFDRDTMRVFRCRISDVVYNGPGGIYFVSSEKSSHDSRRKYTVRQFFPDSNDIATVGEFNSWSRTGAHRRVKELASTPLQEQFDIAMCALDKAVTGKDKSHCKTRYGTIEDAREGGSRSIMYLSDGGYTRVVVKQYDNGSYYLSVVPTFASDQDNDAVRSKFNGAYSLQCEVCRVLLTKPADVAEAVAPFIKTTADEQLVLDINRNGGHCGILQARKLINLARRHHKLMEDYCNGIEVYGNDAEPLPPLRRVTMLLNETAMSVGCSVKFSGDPRGCTVKLVLPSGNTNDWGKEGWCVPI